jgi:hypothetical protein
VETRVVNTLATTAVAAVLAVGPQNGPQRRGRMNRNDIAWLQGLLSRSFNRKFN